MRKSKRHRETRYHAKIKTQKNDKKQLLRDTCRQTLQHIVTYYLRKKMQKDVDGHNIPTQRWTNRLTYRKRKTDLDNQTKQPNRSRTEKMNG